MSSFLIQLDEVKVNDVAFKVLKHVLSGRRMSTSVCDLILSRHDTRNLIADLRYLISTAFQDEGLTLDYASSSASFDGYYYEVTFLNIDAPIYLTYRLYLDKRISEFGINGKDIPNMEDAIAYLKTLVPELEVFGGTIEEAKLDFDDVLRSAFSGKIGVFDRSHIGRLFAKVFGELGNDWPEKFKNVLQNMADGYTLEISNIIEHRFPGSSVVYEMTFALLDANDPERTHVPFDMEFTVESPSVEFVSRLSGKLYDDFQSILEEANEDRGLKEAKLNVGDMMTRVLNGDESLVPHLLDITSGDMFKTMKSSIENAVIKYVDGFYTNGDIISPIASIDSDRYYNVDMLDITIEDTRGVQFILSISKDSVYTVMNCGVYKLDGVYPTLKEALLIASNDDNIDLIGDNVHYIQNIW